MALCPVLLALPVTAFESRCPAAPFTRKPLGRVSVSAALAFRGHTHAAGVCWLIAPVRDLLFLLLGGCCRLILAAQAPLCSLYLLFYLSN